MPATILIVDDDHHFRGLVKRLLEGEQELSVVGEAGDGEEAIRQTRELRPDIVLMDIVLPRLEGLKAIRRIKAERSEARVIVLTIHDEEPYRWAAREIGSDAFLLKKMLMTELISTLRGIASDSFSSVQF